MEEEHNGKASGRASVLELAHRWKSLTVVLIFHVTDRLICSGLQNVEVVQVEARHEIRELLVGLSRNRLHCVCPVHERLLLINGVELHRKLTTLCTSVDYLYLNVCK